MTPEEEEAAPEDEEVIDQAMAEGVPVQVVTDPPGTYGTPPPLEGPEYTRCLNCGHIEPEHDILAKRCLVGDDEIRCGCDGYRVEQPPPQPERRPPYTVAYSVQGHLYEVALSGDATVRAVDGGLVITHHLGPVAGLVQIQPMIKEGQ
jgi:hypothetical protein